MVARHRAFIAPRLVGGLSALAALPVFLAVRGVPGILEFIVLVWMVAPIATACYLSRTGRYESAHVLSALSLTGVATAVAAYSGGIDSIAAIWLVLIPLEATVSGSRRVVAVAAVLSLGGAALLMLADPGSRGVRNRRPRRARHRVGLVLRDRHRARRRLDRARRFPARSPHGTSAAACSRAT